VCLGSWKRKSSIPARCFARPVRSLRRNCSASRPCSGAWLNWCNRMGKSPRLFEEAVTGDSIFPRYLRQNVSPVVRLVRTPLRHMPKYARRINDISNAQPPRLHFRRAWGGHTELGK
jgi:hypothetical protein